MPALRRHFCFRECPAVTFRTDPGRRKLLVKNLRLNFRECHAGTTAGGGRASVGEAERLGIVALVALPGVSCDAYEAKYPWPRLLGRRGTSIPPGRDAVSSWGRGG